MNDRAASDTARGWVALVVFVPALAGCAVPSPAALIDGFDPTVPHCVGECGRIVDPSPRTAANPSIAVDPLDPDHIVIAQMEHRGTDRADPAIVRTSVSMTYNGGATWAAKAVLPGPEAGVRDPLAGYTIKGYLPSVSFLRDGTLLLVAGATNDQHFGRNSQVTTGDALYTMRSSDGGESWEDFTFVDQGGGALVVTEGAAAPAAGLDLNFEARAGVGLEGSVFLVWSQYLQGHADNDHSQEREHRLVFSRSRDGGVSWTPAAVVDADGVPSWPAPSVGRDGVWRIAYVDAETAELRFATSADHGETWNVRVIGESHSYPALRAQTTASGVERLLLAYVTTEGARPGEYRPELAWSDDGGATWAPGVAVDEGQPAPSAIDLAPGAGDSVWLALIDDADPRAASDQTGYTIVKVVGGVPGAPLDLHTLEDGRLGSQKVVLAALPGGDAAATWVIAKGARPDPITPPNTDLVWARITGGDEPVAQILPQRRTPLGLAEPVAYEFTGHVDGPYYCYDPHDVAESAVRDRASAEFALAFPPGTRYVNGSLAWETQGPTFETSDLDVVLYGPEGRELDPGDAVPETFEFELQDGDEGAWTAVVYNCQNPPTDFTLEVLLS